MQRKRDSKAEYARRIASGERRGLTRSQARGHARIGELRSRPQRALQSDPRLEAALREFHNTRNRDLAAKSVNLAPERFRRFLNELGDQVEITGRGKSLKISDHRPREMTVHTAGESRTLTLRDRNQSSFNGKYLSAVRQFIGSNDIELLLPFAGQSVIDAKGKTHLLETDPNTLHRIATHGDEVFHNVYRLTQ